MSAVGDWVAAAGSDDDEMHHHHGSLPTIVSPSDLFDGELFGDELIDIYNSTVDGHDDNDGTCSVLFLLNSMHYNCCRFVRLSLYQQRLTGFVSRTFYKMSSYTGNNIRNREIVVVEKGRRRGRNVSVHGRWVWNVSSLHLVQ